MHYKYPPIYKYIILLILITTFLKYYKNITKENYLLIAFIFIYMIFIFDFILIENHPDLFNNNTISNNKQVISIKPKKKKIKVIIDNKVVNDNNKIDDEDTIKEKEEETTTTENITEEIKKELEELNL
jgi:hypothetical protein